MKVLQDGRQHFRSPQHGQHAAGKHLSRRQRPRSGRQCRSSPAHQSVNQSPVNKLQSPSWVCPRICGIWSLHVSLSLAKVDRLSSNLRASNPSSVGESSTLEARPYWHWFTDYQSADRVTDCSPHFTKINRKGIRTSSWLPSTTCVGTWVASASIWSKNTSHCVPKPLQAQHLVGGRAAPGLDWCQRRGALMGCRDRCVRARPAQSLGSKSGKGLWGCACSNLCDD